MKMKRRLKRFSLADFLIYTAIAIFGFMVFYPLYNSVLISIVPQYEAIKHPFMLYPPKLDFSSYKFAFTSTDVASGVLVSATKVIFAGTLSMTLTLLTAYALTRPLPGRRFIYVFLMIPAYFGGGMIPNYLLIDSLGLMNSIWALILPSSVSFGTVLIFMRYFNTLPVELEESARLDGANDIVILFRIMMPLMKPIIATYFLYGAVANWNSWFDGMLYIRSARKMPIQTVLRNIIQQSTISTMETSSGERTAVYTEGVKMACLVIGMAPIMAFYPFLQKYFVTGITAGAVKG